MHNFGTGQLDKHIVASLSQGAELNVSFDGLARPRRILIQVSMAMVPQEFDIGHAGDLAFGKFDFKPALAREATTLNLAWKKIFLRHVTYLPVRESWEGQPYLFTASSSVGRVLWIQPDAPLSWPLEQPLRHLAESGVILLRPISICKSPNHFILSG
jgi:hypothetical protein